MSCSVGKTDPASSQDGAEADVGVGRLQHAPREQRQRLADEGGEVEIRRGAELLAVAEDADEAHRDPPGRPRACRRPVRGRAA